MARMIYKFTAAGCPADAEGIGHLEYDVDSEGDPANFKQVEESVRGFAEKHLTNPRLIVSLPHYWPIFQGDGGAFVSIYEMIPLQLINHKLGESKYSYTEPVEKEVIKRD